MGDHARLALRPRGLAVRAGSRRAARRDAARKRITNRADLLPSRYSLLAIRLSSARRQVLHRIDRRRSLADLEVQLWRRHAAGLARLCDHLTASHGVVALDHQLAGMRVGGDEAVGVPDQDQVAVALELAARIGDDAVV